MMSAKRLVLLSMVLSCTDLGAAQTAPAGGSAPGGAGAPAGATSPSTPPTGNTGTPPTGAAQTPTGKHYAPRRGLPSPST